MSWTNEKTLQFIGEYEKRHILWKKDEKLYHNVLKKEDSWRELSTIFGEDPESLKKKMESLRGSRRREKNRVAGSMGTGKGRNEIYVSNLFAWDSMKLLDDSEERQPTLDNCTPQEDETQGTDSSESHGDRNDNNSQQGSQLLDKHPPVPNVNNGMKQFRSPLKRLAPKRRTVVAEAYRILKNAEKNQEAPPKKDESAMFGDFIAEKLRKLRPRERAILEHQIHGLVLQAEFAQISPSPLLPSFTPLQSPSSASSDHTNFSPARQTESPIAQSPHIERNILSPVTDTSAYTPLYHTLERSQESQRSSGVGESEPSDVCQFFTNYQP